jgi:hypothetical protein
MEPVAENDRFYQHDEMCCDLETLGSNNMCKTCNKIKRKLPTDTSLVRENENQSPEMQCTLCETWKPLQHMRKDNQYLLGRDHVCQSCFAQCGPYRGVKGKQEHSLRTVRFSKEGEMRRCSQLKHWVPVEDIQANSKFADGLGVSCKRCLSQGIKRKLSKSVRAYHFNGRKIHKAELGALGVTVDRFHLGPKRIENRVQKQSV